MPSLALRFALLGLSLVWPGIAISAPAAQAEIAHPAPGGTVEESTCRIVESAARSSHVPVDLLTRLMWQESRFRANATSPAGAQGIAQFMPTTAQERGLADPFDPEQAIPKAATLLVDLEHRFGNIGLAAAAYNAGPARVADWLAGGAGLPAQTRAYVLAITGRAAEDWAADRRQATRADTSGSNPSCIAVTASLRTEDGAAPRTQDGVAPIPVAPWGVQLSGNFSKAIALASFDRARQRYRAVVGDLRPMIIGGVLRSRGTRPFYRVMLPASSRAQADQLCGAILSGGGACVALRT